MLDCVITSIAGGVEAIGLAPHIAELAAPGVGVHPSPGIHKAWWKGGERGGQQGRGIRARAKLSVGSYSCLALILILILILSLKEIKYMSTWVSESMNE